MPFNEVGIVFQLTSWEAELLQFIFLTVVHLKNIGSSKSSVYYIEIGIFQGHLHTTS